METNILAEGDKTQTAKWNIQGWNNPKKSDVSYVHGIGTPQSYYPGTWTGGFGETRLATEFGMDELKQIWDMVDPKVGVAYRW